jgi:hypothetical protein
MGFYSRHIFNKVYNFGEMPTWTCCDNPGVSFVRKEPTSDGGTREYYKCISCGRDHIVTKDANGREVDHKEI